MGDRLYAGWAAGDGTDGAGAGGAGRPDGASVAAAYAAGMWAGDPAAAAAAAAAAVAVGPPLAGPDAALHGLPPPGAAQPASYTVQLPPRRPTDAAMASPDHGAGYEHLRYVPGLAYAPPRPRPPSHAPLHRQHPHHVQHSAFSYAHPPNAFMPPDHHPPHSSQHHQHLPQYYPTQGPAEYHTHTLQPQPQQPPPPEYPARQTQSTPARLAMPSQFNPQQPLPAAPSRGPHERSSDFGAYPHACHDALGPPAAMRRQWSDDALAPQLPPAKMAAVPPAHAVYAHGGGGAAAGTWYGAGAELRSTYAADEPPNDEPGPPARPSSAPSHPHELAPDAVTSRSAPPGAARRLDLDLSVETYAMNRSLPPAQLPDDVANSLRAAFRDHVATPNGGAHTFLNEVGARGPPSCRFAQSGADYRFAPAVALAG